MARATGIGGFFFRCADPAAIAAWYEKYFEIPPPPDDAAGTPWMTGAGVTVFAAFDAGTDYFEADRSAMINLRVDDLDGMRAKFIADGVAVGPLQDIEGIGRFTRIHDPEGNPVEMWEPAGS